MARRETLGRGALESKHVNESLPSTEHARTCFLEAVQTIVPQVLDDLAGEPYRLFRQTDLYFEANGKRDKKNPAVRYLWNRDRRPSWKDIEYPPTASHPLINYRALWQCSPIDTDKNIIAFRNCLIEWSRDSKLNEIWCRTRAYGTLDWWCLSPESYNSRSWKYEIAWPHTFLIRGEPRFVFERKTQYPLINSHEDELKVAVGEFKRQYDEFLTRMDKGAEASGLKPAPVKPPKHTFEILVRYHLQEWNQSRIAKEYLLSEKRVSHIIPDTARLIELTLRPRRGRPRKH